MSAKEIAELRRLAGDVHELNDKIHGPQTRSYSGSNASLSFELWNGNRVEAEGHGLTTEEMRVALAAELKRLGG